MTECKVVREYDEQGRLIQMVCLRPAVCQEWVFEVNPEDLADLPEEEEEETEIRDEGTEIRDER